MSYLSVALQRQIGRHGFTQSDIARGSGLSKSYISRLFSGEAHDLSDQNFVAILKNFSADPLAQGEIVAARCMDAREGARSPATPGADLVEIRVKPGALPARREPELPAVPLSAEAEQAFAWLRSQCPLNPDLEQHLIGYAKLTGMK